MEELSATFEYVVSPKARPQYRLRRVLFIIGYIVWVVGTFTGGVISKLLVPCLALVPLSTWILVWLTWRYAAVEFEYSLTGGIMTLSHVYGNKSRRKIAEIRIKEMSLIAPFEGETIEKATAYAPEETIDMTSDLQSPDCYIALFETENHRRGILYFEATAQSLRILRHYNPGATVMKQVRY